MAENTENSGCLQRDSAEHEGYVKARRSFNLIWKERDSAQPKLLEAILPMSHFLQTAVTVTAQTETQKEQYLRLRSTLNWATHMR